MNRTSRILFHIGNAALFLLGVAHLLGHLSGPPEPANEGQRLLLSLLARTTFEMPTGESRTFYEIQNAFSLYFVIFPIGMAAILLLAERQKIDMRPLLVAASLFVFAAAAVTYVYAILPPLLMMLLTSICFLASAFAAKHSR